MFKYNNFSDSEKSQDKNNLKINQKRADLIEEKGSRSPQKKNRKALINSDQEPETDNYQIEKVE